MKAYGAWSYSSIHFNLRLSVKVSDQFATLPVLPPVFKKKEGKGTGWFLQAVWLIWGRAAPHCDPLILHPSAQSLYQMSSFCYIYNPKR
jgi:hypothetical protein